MVNKLDIILFGATGFTGKKCIEPLYKFCKADGKSLTWGIAGRSEAKLKGLLKEYENKIPKVLDSIPIVVADIKDSESLKKMTARAKVIINCCGPYLIVGEPVIKACVETGTHQVDVTGEPQYMESIQLKYHKEAQEKGIYLISACGFDSVAADFGVVFLQKNFQGTLNSVETYLEAKEEPPVTPGPIANYTSYETAVHNIGNSQQLANLRRQLHRTLLPELKPKLKAKPQLHKSDIINDWCVPFLGSDRSVALRSQRYLYEYKKIRPAQVQTYLGVQSVFNIIVFAIFGSIFMLLAKFEFGRKLLLNYPRFFSAGFISHEGPSEEKLKKLKISITFRGEGWNEKLSEPDDNFTTPPNKTILTRVRGTDVYTLTCNAVTLAAITVITETNKIPDKGGVLSPGVAFYDTSYIEKLQESGLVFEILQSN